MVNNMKTPRSKLRGIQEVASPCKSEIFRPQDTFGNEASIGESDPLRLKMPSAHGDEATGDQRVRTMPTRPPTSSQGTGTPMDLSRVCARSARALRPAR